MLLHEDETRMCNVTVTVHVCLWIGCMPIILFCRQRVRDFQKFVNEFSSVYVCVHVEKAES